MIRFLLVLLAFVSALLAFIFQETALFVAAGGLLMISVILLLLHLREQSKRRNRLRLPNNVTPEDELRVRGVLDVRPKPRVAKPSEGYAPPGLTGATPIVARVDSDDVFGIRVKDPMTNPSAEEVTEPVAITSSEDNESDAGIPWSVLSTEPNVRPESSEMEDNDESLSLERVATGMPSIDESKTLESISAESAKPDDTTGMDAASHEGAHAVREVAATLDDLTPEDEASGIEEPVESVADDETEKGELERSATAESDRISAASFGRTDRKAISRRRVEVDAHLPALQTSVGAHTICLIDVDTEGSVYRLRSIVSSGLVDHAGTEYPFSDFFLSDLLAETTVLDVGLGDFTLADLRYHRDRVPLKQVVAEPVMKDGLPAAFLVASFTSAVDESSKQAMTRAAAFFGSLYALQGDLPSRGDSLLTRAKRKPPSLRLVKSNPKSTQSRIIAEEMNRARGESYPLAFALVCLDKGDEIARSDEVTVYRVEEWMRRCLEQITPDGRIEYLGELGYGIIQLRDVRDVEGWVRRAQQIFRSQHGPVDASPIVGVAMLSDGHRDPEDLQADAVRALRAAYETGDSTILVG